MQTIGPPKQGNGTLDTILVQAEGDTGDHTDRRTDLNESLSESGDVKAPECNKASVYDGQGWKGI
jgi:hypothetical protein